MLHKKPFILNLRIVTLASRGFHPSTRRLQDPIFDPSQLNPLRDKYLKNKNQNSKEALLNLKPKYGEETVISQNRVSAFNLQPKDDALSSRLTGVTAGRTVDVYNKDTASAFRQLNSVMFANRIPQMKRDQRYYMKPGKIAEMKRSQRHRRDFMKGFKRLIEIVKDAKRKGY